MKIDFKRSFILTVSGSISVKVLGNDVINAIKIHEKYVNLVIDKFGIVEDISKEEMVFFNKEDIVELEEYPLYEVTDNNNNKLFIANSAIQAVEYLVRYQIEENGDGGYDASRIKSVKSIGSILCDKIEPDSE